MNSVEIYHYSILSVQSASLIYAGALIFNLSLGVVNIFSKRIENQNELEKILFEEMEKLNLNKNICAILKPNTTGCVEKFTFKKKELDFYLISVGGSLASRETIKHELYHVFRNHLETKPKNKIVEHLKYIFIEEPQALIYEVFSLKL